MRIRPFQAVYPNFDFIASPDSFFGTVKEQYSAFNKSGFFQKTAQESLYIYQIQTKQRTYTGLIACADIRDFNEGKIKKHENTLPVKEQQQMHLLLERRAVVKPVLLTYSGVKKINDLFLAYINANKAFFSTFFEEKKETHTFWEVSDGQEIQEIQTLFKKLVKETYIADGHHRTSTTALMDRQMSKRNDGVDYSQLLSVFFPSSELDIYDYNRVIDVFNEISPATFMAKLSKLFDIEVLEEERKPSQKFELTMVIEKDWFRLNWKKEVLKKYKKSTAILDANLLDQEVLNNILGITDTRNDERIKYVDGPSGIEEINNKVGKSNSRVGFLLYPVFIEDLFSIADAGEIMPPKSTWFEPRIKNGLIVLEI